MAQFLILNDNVKSWLFQNLETITGFVTGSTTTSFVIVNSIGLTLINALIVAVVSGFVGGFFAWIFKSICTPFLDNKLKSFKQKKLKK
jgi:hypothetical protein